MTLTFILTIHVTGPALGFPCFCRAWNSKTPSGPWFPPCRLHMQTSAPLSGSTAGRSQRMHFTPLASGRRLPALGVQVLVGALLEHPAGLSPSGVCSKADVPTKPKKKTQKNPQGSANMQGIRWFSAEGDSPPALPCCAPGAAALASPWKSLRSREGRAEARRSVPARTARSEHQRKKLSASLCSC